MPRNLELKASLNSIRGAETTARSLGARFAGTLAQLDVYFAVPRGRMKIRSIDGRRHELISYQRPNRRSGRFSDYVVTPLDDPRPLRKILTRQLGVLAVIRKRRRLYLYRNARIHLDAVSGLGNFIEFEVLVTRGTAQAKSLFEELRSAFDIHAAQTIAGSYSDLILKRRVIALPRRRKA